MGSSGSLGNHATQPLRKGNDDPIHDRGRATRVCRLCKARKKGCDKQLPSCTYCAQRGFTCTYEDDSSPTSSDFDPRHGQGRNRLLDSSDELVGPFTTFLHPVLFSSPQYSVDGQNKTLARHTASHARYLFRAVELSPLDASTVFLQVFQRWLPIVPPDKLYEKASMLENGTPEADISLLFATICLITMRPYSGHPSRIIHHSNHYIATKMMYAHIQASASSSLALIQAGVILAAYEYATGRLDSAYISIAACTRIAQVVGIDQSHGEMSAHDSERNHQAEEKWNTWWAIIVLERFIRLELAYDTTASPLASCPNPNTPGPCDFDSGDEDSLRYQALSLPSKNRTASLSSFGRQAQAIYLLDDTLKVLHGPFSIEQRLWEVKKLDNELQDSLIHLMGLKQCGRGLRCGAIATVIRSLYILHQDVLSKAASIPVKCGRDHWIQRAEETLDSVTRIMVDVARHHLDYVSHHGVESLAICCQYNLRVAIRHVNMGRWESHCDGESCLIDIEPLHTLERALYYRWTMPKV